MAGRYVVRVLARRHYQMRFFHEQRDLKEQTRRLEEEEKESLRVLKEQTRRLCEENEALKAFKAEAQRLVLQIRAQAEEDM